MSYRGKAILLGNASVGKTSLLSQFVDGKFFDEYIQTIGANFLIKEIDLKDCVDQLRIDKDLITDIEQKGFKLYFWDIGGQQDKLFVTEYYFVQSHGAIVVFDLADRKSFDDLDFWISKLKELSGEIPFIMIGNKKDLDKKRVISEEEIKEKAKKHDVAYFETSAKLDENVNEAFLALSIKILNNIK